MKVNESLVQTFMSKSVNSPVNQSEFEQWINTPSRQNTGDEYYWQHQEQLQNSSLRFEQHFLEQLPHEITIKEEQMKQNISSCEHPVESQCSLASSHESVTYTHNVDSHLFLQSEDCSNPNQEPCQQSVSTASCPAPNKAIESLKTEAPGTIQYKMPQTLVKKHHMYIQNDEVELSLNTQELNQNEEQELHQMIQLHLKNKGLSLKQLLINGVKK